MYLGSKSSNGWKCQVYNSTLDVIQNKEGGFLMGVRAGTPASSGKQIHTNWWFLRWCLSRSRKAELKQRGMCSLSKAFAFLVDRGCWAGCKQKCRKLFSSPLCSPPHLSSAARKTTQQLINSSHRLQGELSVSCKHLDIIISTVHLTMMIPINTWLSQFSLGGRAVISWLPKRLLSAGVFMSRPLPGPKLLLMLLLDF